MAILVEFLDRRGGLKEILSGEKRSFRDDQFAGSDVTGGEEAEVLARRFIEMIRSGCGGHTEY